MLPTLGSTRGLLGRLEDSRLAFLRALELDPNHTVRLGRNQECAEME